MFLDRCVSPKVLMAAMMVVMFNYKAASTSFIATDVGQQSHSDLNIYTHRMDFGPSRETGGCTMQAARIMEEAD